MCASCSCSCCVARGCARVFAWRGVSSVFSCCFRHSSTASVYVLIASTFKWDLYGEPEGTVGPTEAALADHRHGGVVGLVFGAFGECSQSVDLLVESFGKLIGEQGYAEMGNRTPEVGVGWQRGIRREWSMTHWRESAQPHVAELGARDGSVLGARQDEAVHAAPRRVGRRTPSCRDAPRERHQPQAQPPGAAAGGAGVSSACDSLRAHHVLPPPGAK
jgi:hypothetical protein